MNVIDLCVYCLQHWSQRATNVRVISQTRSKMRNVEQKYGKTLISNFVQRAIGRKAATEAVRLVKLVSCRIHSAPRLISTWLDYFREGERQRALELLEEAVREVNRIEGNKPDRALLLVGIANQFDEFRSRSSVGDYRGSW